jgi:hypothetical protein
MPAAATAAAPAATAAERVRNVRLEISAISPTFLPRERRAITARVFAPAPSSDHPPTDTATRTAQRSDLVAARAVG